MYGYISGDGKLQEIKQPVFTIGRHESNDLIINNGSISAFHAKLIFQNGDVFIQDLGSRNGTFINDYRIRTNPFGLTTDNIIRFGIYQARYKVGFQQLQNLEQLSSTLVEFQKQKVNNQIQQIKADTKYATELETVKHFPQVDTNTNNLSQVTKKALDISVEDLQQQQITPKQLGKSSNHEKQQTKNSIISQSSSQANTITQNSNINSQQYSYLNVNLINAISKSLQNFDYNEVIRLTSKFGETKIEKAMKHMLDTISNLPRKVLLPVSEQIKNLQAIVLSIQENMNFLDYKYFKQSILDFKVNQQSDKEFISDLMTEITQLKEENAYLKSLNKSDDRQLNIAINAAKSITQAIDILCIGDINGLNINAILGDYQQNLNSSWKFQ
ncbi:FHA domain-containing protein [Spironucleus salmonicida]|uniref:FHA domain-containing protein n=1 Tax=Spironucleus salmonicida TaxID=348837 RepID=V6LSC7_9EUKA|nr:FHA domain-containing protein [Spironucleus salmonicida]|eukprot:EST46606.1 FHA domain-containing protein [Spironucleus salmonicida]